MNITKIENDLVKINFAINKAVSEDMPQKILENELCTRNYLRYVRGDCINTNIIKIFNNEEFIPIKYCINSWTGVILINTKEKITYTITTHQNIKSIINKTKHKKISRPHIFQILNAMENKNFEPEIEQISLFEDSEFDVEKIEQKYNEVLGRYIDKPTEYKHYIIAYTFSHDIVTKIDMMCFNINFDLIDKKDITYLLYKNYMPYNLNDMREYDNKIDSIDREDRHIRVGFKNKEKITKLKEFSKELENG